MYQIIEYLGRPHNILQEGLFRKHGNLKKQQALKERLNKGIPLSLDEEEFSVHECAAVLKAAAFKTIKCQTWAIFSLSLYCPANALSCTLKEIFCIN